MKTILGQPSWRVAASRVEAFVTERAGHLGPVTFTIAGRKVTPFSVAPWAEEQLDPSVPALLRVLRGDFFCLPFGGNDTPYKGERHPPHGETANAIWSLRSVARQQGRVTLHARLQTQVRRGIVDKRVRLVDGQTAVYQQHVIGGMTGPMNFGHHAMLKFPDEPGSGVISTSRFVHGQVLPGPFEKPEERGYQALRPAATFASLTSVPMVNGERADLTRYPARRGFEDLVTIVADARQPLGWTAVTFPKQRYVWFALKDPRVLRETVFWISNGGRHYPPWSSRHVNVMGLEEVTSCFHFGLAESAAKNGLTRKGYATSVRLNPKRPLVVNYIMGLAAIPAGFDKVAAITPARDRQSVVLRSVSGKSVRVAVDVGFLEAAPL